MSSIQPAAAAQGAASQGTSGTPENPGAKLGKNDFLKLMVAQLQAQNPLEPTKNTEYVAELAQFSQLEQSTNIAQSSTELASAQRTSQAVQLIGHTVSYIDHSTGETVTGKVESVAITSAGATLTVGGVKGVEPALVSGVS